MPYSQGTVDSLTKQAKNTIFYIPKVGILYKRKIFPELTLAENKLLSSIEELPEDKDFLNDVLIYDYDKKNNLQNTIKLLTESGLEPVLITDNPVLPEPIARENIYRTEQKYSNKHVFILLPQNPLNINSVEKWILEHTKETDIKKFKGQKKASIIKHEAQNKPTADKIYDAVLHGEEWSFLSRNEKILRIVSSPLAIALFFISWPIYVGEKKNREKAKEVNLLPWQYRKYKTLQPFDEIISSPNHNLNTKLKAQVTKKGESLGFINNDLITTNNGKLVSKKDNFLLIASNKELTRKQLATRSVIIVGMTTILAARIVHLTGVGKPMYAAAISYIALGACLVAACLAIKKSNVKTIAIIFTLLLLSTLTFLALYQQQNNAMPGYEQLASVALIVSVVIMACVQLAFNRYYKKDREMAKELNLSTTAYLQTKKRVEKEYIGSPEYKGDTLGHQTDDHPTIAIIQAIKDGIYGEELKQELEQKYHQEKSKKAPKTDQNNTAIASPVNLQQMLETLTKDTNTDMYKNLAAFDKKLINDNQPSTSQGISYQLQSPQAYTSHDNKSPKK